MSFTSLLNSVFVCFNSHCSHSIALSSVHVLDALNSLLSLVLFCTLYSRCISLLWPVVSQDMTFEVKLIVAMKIEITVKMV